MALKAKLPTPGQTNMDSTTAVPPIRDPIDKPVSVITVIMNIF